MGGNDEAIAEAGCCGGSRTVAEGEAAPHCGLREVEMVVEKPLEKETLE